MFGDDVGANNAEGHHNAKGDRHDAANVICWTLNRTPTFYLILRNMIESKSQETFYLNFSIIDTVLQDFENIKAYKSFLKAFRCCWNLHAHFLSSLETKQTVYIRSTSVTATPAFNWLWAKVPTLPSFSLSRCHTKLFGFPTISLETVMIPYRTQLPWSWQKQSWSSGHRWPHWGGPRTPPATNAPDSFYTPLAQCVRWPNFDWWRICHQHFWCPFHYPRQGWWLEWTPSGLERGRSWTLDPHCKLVGRRQAAPSSPKIRVQSQSSWLSFVLKGWCLKTFRLINLIFYSNNPIHLFASSCDQDLKPYLELSKEL